MSEPTSPFAFPHRTPVFTTVMVLVCFAAFGWLARKVYVPHAAEVAPVEGVKSPAERKALLVDHRAKEQAEASSYGWIDQKAGVVRLPIDRAIALTAEEYSRKEFRR